MKLYFLRHGPADSRSTWAGNDEQRPLTHEGERRVRRVARRLAELGVKPEVILASPYERARRTAEIVGDVLGCEGCVTSEKGLRSGFDLHELRQILDAHADAESIMLVGHEPDFSSVIGDLIGGANLAMKKAGLAEVDLASIETMCGVLTWLTPPARLTG